VVDDIVKSFMKKISGTYVKTRGALPLEGGGELTFGNKWLTKRREV
jgi:hypothetical protein